MRYLVVAQEKKDPKQQTCINLFLQSGISDFEVTGFLHL